MVEHNLFSQTVELMDVGSGYHWLITSSKRDTNITDLWMNTYNLTLEVGVLKSGRSSVFFHQKVCVAPSISQ